MPYEDPFVNIRSIDGKSVAVPGTVEEVTERLRNDGPLVLLADLYGKAVTINAQQVVRIDGQNQ